MNSTLGAGGMRGGRLVMFICNHCPYVRAVIDRIVRDAQAVAPLGIGCVAISSNDAVAYPEDSFARMREFAREHKFSFPYLYDESQEVARAYGAVCTPDFFASLLLWFERATATAISRAARCLGPSASWRHRSA